MVVIQHQVCQFCGSSQPNFVKLSRSYVGPRQLVGGKGCPLSHDVCMTALMDRHNPVCTGKCKKNPQNQQKNKNKTPTRADLSQAISRCHHIHKGRLKNWLCVGFGSGSDEQERKQEDPLPGLLMHYQLEAPQQASTATYQGAEPSYCQGHVWFF